jgi:hypothetical protein
MERKKACPGFFLQSNLLLKNLQPMYVAARAHTYVFRSKANQNVPKMKMIFGLQIYYLATLGACAATTADGNAVRQGKCVDWYAIALPVGTG